MVKLFRLLILVIITTSLAACGSDTPTPVPTAEPPDSKIKELYDQLGGVNNLGPIISPSFEYNGISYQYAQAALLVYDPLASANQRRRLEPLGRDFNITEPPVPRPERSDVRYVEGHIIYEKFLPLYEQLGGVRFVGRPLTEMHYNPIRLRYEQFFENLGFYIHQYDLSETVRLLAYGVFKCDSNCRQPGQIDGTVDRLHGPDPQFVDAVSRLGSDFTGAAISDAYTTPDGYLEQVYQNLVLVADPNQPGRIFPREITQSVGNYPEPLAERSSDPETYFYAVQGEDRGYNITRPFMDYIAQHGGLEITGAPIGERRLWNNDVYRQCFTNLCLEEHLDEVDYRRIQPAQIGYIYIQTTVAPVMGATAAQEPPVDISPEQPEPVVQPTEAVMPAPVQESTPIEQPTAQPVVEPAAPIDPSSQSASQISIRVWETFSVVAPDQNQEIGVSVYENNAPLSGIEPDIKVTLPDGSIRSYYMYPTGGDGQTRMQVEPIAAPSGTLILYEVCVFLLGGQKLCVGDSYMIWVSP